MPDPEQLARIDIDRQLCLSGWIVQDSSALNLTAGPGAAIREVSIPGVPLTGVEVQSNDFAKQLPPFIKAWPLPVALPPVEEQTRFVAEVEGQISVFDRTEAEVTANLKRAESLRQSMLHRAFSCRLISSLSHPFSLAGDGSGMRVTSPSKGSVPGVAQ